MPLIDIDDSPTSHDTDDIDEFLSTLWGCVPVGKYLSFAVDPIEGRFASAGYETDLDGAVKRVAALNDGTQSVYVGVQPRDNNDTARGGNADISCLVAFYVDIDTADGVHAKDDLPTRLQAMNAISAFPVPATMIVDSGGGLHAYWVLTSVYLGDPAEVALLLRRFGKLARDVCAQHGADGGLDPVFDPARVMRVPGTWNVKPVKSGGEPVMARLLDLGSRVNLNLMLRHFPEEEEPRPAASMVYDSDAAAAWELGAYEPTEEEMSRPGELFDRVTDIGQVLTTLGWTFVGTQGDRDLWARPGSDPGDHQGAVRENRIMVWSPNCGLPIEDGGSSFGPFALLAYGSFGGDFAAAAKAVAARLGVAHDPSGGISSPGLGSWFSDRDDAPSVDIEMIGDDTLLPDKALPWTLQDFIDAAERVPELGSFPVNHELEEVGGTLLDVLSAYERRIRLEGVEVAVTPTGIPLFPEDAVMDVIPEFGPVFEAAEAAGVDPGLLFFMVLERLAALVPPWVKVSIIGPGHPLNFVIGYAARSSGGKGTAARLARTLVPLNRPGFSEPVEPVSAEAIGGQFVGGPAGQARVQCGFQVLEIEAARRTQDGGFPVESVSRKLTEGESLSGAKADKSTSRAFNWCEDYRATLSIHGQGGNLALAGFWTGEALRNGGFSRVLTTVSTDRQLATCDALTLGAQVEPPMSLDFAERMFPGYNPMIRVEDGNPPVIAPWRQASGSDPDEWPRIGDDDSAPTWLNQVWVACEKPSDGRKNSTPVRAFIPRGKLARMPEDVYLLKSVLPSLPGLCERFGVAPSAEDANSSLLLYESGNQFRLAALMSVALGIGVEGHDALMSSDRFEVRDDYFRLAGTLMAYSRGCSLFLAKLAAAWEREQLRRKGVEQGKVAWDREVSLKAEMRSALDEAVARCVEVVNRSGRLTLGRLKRQVRGPVRDAVDSQDAWNAVFHRTLEFGLIPEHGSDGVLVALLPRSEE